MGVEAFRNIRGRHPRECAICGFKGKCWAGGVQPLTFDAQCPKCRSIGRHRQHFLLIERHPDWIDAADVLHFAPEVSLEKDYTARLAASGRTYIRADYMPRKGETKVDMQAIQFADNSFDTVICHNILEHVGDDRLGLRELFRVTRAGGRVILSVPLIDSWQDTFEDSSVTSEESRDLYFNQYDHLRLYGRDIYQRLDEAGFDIEAYVAQEPEVSRFGLERGETIFICQPRK